MHRQIAHGSRLCAWGLFSASTWAMAVDPIVSIHLDTHAIDGIWKLIPGCKVLVNGFFRVQHSLKKDPSGFTEAQDLVRHLQRISLSVEHFVLPDIERRKTHGPLCLETDVLHDIFGGQPTSIMGFAFSRREVRSRNSFCKCFPLTSEVFCICFGKRTSWDVQDA